MHLSRLVALDESGSVPEALQEGSQLVVGDTGEDGGVGDLVAIQVQDRHDGPVPPWVEELIGVPARGQRPCLRLPITDDAEDDEVRVIEGGAVRVSERVAELAPLVNRARRLGGHVAGDAAGEGELAEEPPHPLNVRRDVSVDLAVGAFKVGVGQDPWGAVPRPDDVDRVQVAVVDHPVQVDIDEVQPRRGAPVPQQPRLDVLKPQRLPEQRVVQQVYLAHGEVIRRPPPGVHALQRIGGQGRFAGRNLGSAVCGLTHSPTS